MQACKCPSMSSISTVYRTIQANFEQHSLLGTQQGLPAQTLDRIRYNNIARAKHRRFNIIRFCTTFNKHASEISRLPYILKGKFTP